MFSRWFWYISIFFYLKIFNKSRLSSFSSNVKDMSSVLEITVFDEDRDHKVEFLGRLAIPLMRIHNGEKRWYALKDKKMFTRAKGNSPQVHNSKFNYLINFKCNLKHII